MLSSLAACDENIKSGHTLSDSEREYLRARAALKCIAESDQAYKNLTNSMNENMLNFERNQTWKYEYKKTTDNGQPVLVETSYLYVWKVSPPHVYFRLLLNGDTTTNQFLKVSTDVNSDMLRNLQKLKCDKDLTLSGSSSLTANIEDPRIRIDDNNLSDTETDYRILSSYPAYFGKLNHKKTKLTLDNDEKVTKTEVSDYIISTNAATTQPLDYNDSTFQNLLYCVVEYTSDTPLNKYEFPFELECVSSDTTGPDANGDGVSDFTPNVELAGPF